MTDALNLGLTDNVIINPLSIETLYISAPSLLKKNLLNKSNKAPYILLFKEILINFF